MKKSDTRKLEAGRRALLKSSAIMSSGLLAGNVLPESWAKPIVNAVLLPAHAATTEAADALPGETPPVPPPPVEDVNPCVGESLSISGDDQVFIDISYDGQSAPVFSVRSRPDLGLPNNDVLLGISKVPGFAVGPGRNWVDGVPRIEPDVADGVYTRTVVRAVDGQPSSARYSVTFCIMTSGVKPDRRLTVTLVSIDRISG